MEITEIQKGVLSKKWSFYSFLPEENLKSKRLFYVICRLPMQNLM
ncbi:MAG: hypothetical protein ABFD75_16185 [Smithella sp.]